MGYGYVRANYGDNCFYRDSAFKRYNRAHGDTTIFNFNYGTPNYCCGGGKRLNFWSGLGMGFGYNLGSWLMGGMNMLGGWLGLGNMGCNFFGGGNLLGGNSYSGSWYNNTTGGQSKTITVTKKDKEYTNINSAREKLQGLQNKGNVTEAEIKDLEKTINALKAEDGVNDKDNQKQIDMLKADFEKLKGNASKAAAPVAPTAKKAPAETTAATTKTSNEKLNALPEDTKKALKATSIPDNKLNELLEAGYTADDIIALNAKGLTPEEMKTLKAIGAEYRDGALTCPSELTADKLTKLADISNSKKIPVAMGYNSNAKISDKWIKGYIDKESIKSENNKLSYSIDCKDVDGAKFGNKYKVEQQEGNTYKISVQECRKGVNKGDKDYTWTPANKRLERDGEAIVSEK